MLSIVAALHGRALVVVDEAYVEFAGVASLAGEIDRHPNLAILRTLSKAYALAGARCGTLVAHPDVVGLLRRIIPPYALPAASVEETLRLTEAPQLAIAAARVRRCSPSAKMRSACGAADDRRCSLRSQLPAGRVPRRPGARGRSFGGTAGRDFSRPTARVPRIPVGTPEQNERLLEALAALRAANGSCSSIATARSSRNRPTSRSTACASCGCCPASSPRCSNCSARATGSYWSATRTAGTVVPEPRPRAPGLPAQRSFAGHRVDAGSSAPHATAALPQAGPAAQQFLQHRWTAARQ
jgi:hypothetical protein